MLILEILGKQTENKYLKTKIGIKRRGTKKITFSILVETEQVVEWATFSQTPLA